jgi:uncharacterized protein
MNSILSIPGLGGSGEHHWHTHWEQSIPNARRLEQAHWQRPDLFAWLKRLENAIDRFGTFWLPTVSVAPWSRLWL